MNISLNLFEIAEYQYVTKSNYVDALVFCCTKKFDLMHPVTKFSQAEVSTPPAYSCVHACLHHRISKFQWNGTIPVWNYTNDLFHFFFENQLKVKQTFNWNDTLEMFFYLQALSSWCWNQNLTDLFSRNMLSLGKGCS